MRSLSAIIAMNDAAQQRYEQQQAQRPDNQQQTDRDIANEQHRIANLGK